MKNKNTTQQLNLKDFYNFARLQKNKQVKDLVKHGIFLDVDYENNTKVKLYFLRSFFVEMVTFQKNNRVIEVIPFKRGYKLENYVELNQVNVPLSKHINSKYVNKNTTFHNVHQVLSKYSTQPFAILPITNHLKHNN